MYKAEEHRYINAGENVIYRYGHKAVDRVKAWMTPNEGGYYNFPVNGGRYWTIGTSNGKYGEFANIKGTLFSVNSNGMMWAKAGTEKAEKFVAALESLIEEMNRINDSRFAEEEEEEA